MYLFETSVYAPHTAPMQRNEAFNVIAWSRMLCMVEDQSQSISFQIICMGIVSYVSRILWEQKVVHATFELPDHSLVAVCHQHLDVSRHFGEKCEELGNALLHPLKVSNGPAGNCFELVLREKDCPLASLRRRSARPR